MEIAQFRARMPLIVFVLLALVCLLMLGFACACLTEQPALALERAMQAPALTALVEVWALIVLLAFAPTLFFGRTVAGRTHASPVLLQRFLF